jgi:hypothetical protein
VLPNNGRNVGKPSTRPEQLLYKGAFHQVHVIISVSSCRQKSRSAHRFASIGDWGSAIVSRGMTNDVIMYHDLWCPSSNPQTLTLSVDLSHLQQLRYAQARKLAMEARLIHTRLPSLWLADLGFIGFSNPRRARILVHWQYCGSTGRLLSLERIWRAQEVLTFYSIVISTVTFEHQAQIAFDKTRVDFWRNEGYCTELFLQGTSRRWGRNCSSYFQLVSFFWVLYAIR